MKMTLILIIGILLAAINLYTFLLMRRDKKAAIKGERRIPESRLFLACACFGALGGVLGMQIMRHKTRKWYFRFFFPCLLILQTAVLILAACVYLR